MEQVILARSFTRHQNLVRMIVFPCNLMHFVNKCKGFIPLFRKVQKHQHTAVFFPLELVCGKLHFIMCFRQGIHHVVIQRHIAFLHLVIDEVEHVN